MKKYDTHLPNIELIMDITAELLLQFLILCAAVYLAFFKSYLSEKGKSVALKEDLNGLTREVEKVKDEFVKEQEILKTDLQRLLSNELSYRDEERDALIDFHSIISEWKYAILEFGIYGYNISSINDLIKCRNQISAYYAKAGKANSKVSLLIEHKDLVKTANDLYSETMKFHHWTDSYFLRLQQMLERLKSNTDRFLVVLKHFDANKDLAQSMANDDEKLHAEIAEMQQDYLDKRNDESFKIEPFNVKYSTFLKEYLKT